MPPVRSNENLRLNRFRVQLSVTRVVAGHQHGHQLIARQDNRGHEQKMSGSLVNSRVLDASFVCPPGPLIVAVGVGEVVLCRQVVLPFSRCDREHFPYLKDVVNVFNTWWFESCQLRHQDKLYI